MKLDRQSLVFFPIFSYISQHMNLIALSIKECLGDSDSLLCNSKKIITCFLGFFSQTALDLIYT